MSQYRDGTVTLVNGDATVTGTGTAFTTNVAAGDLFDRTGDGVAYYVGSVTDDTHLELSAAYAGVGGSGLAYLIHTSFTTRGYPYPEGGLDGKAGDIDTAVVMKEAMRLIDQDMFAHRLASYQWDSWVPSDLIGAATNASGTGTGDASAYATPVNSAGTVTLTFDVAGRYLININAATAHANAYTLDRLTANLGGTATRRYGLTTPRASGEDASNADTVLSVSFCVSATAGQTLTILPTFEVTGSGTTAQHVAHANVTALFCGGA